MSGLAATSTDQARADPSAAVVKTIVVVDDNSMFAQMLASWRSKVALGMAKMLSRLAAAADEPQREQASGRQRR
jgi:hypothetical protein